MRKVRVWVESTFRGVKQPGITAISRSSPKSDFILIPKDEEANICGRKVDTNKSTVILPRTMEFPPLLKELILRDNKIDKSFKTPRLEVCYNRTSTETKYRIAEEGETPTFELPVGLGTPVSPELYEGVKLK